MSDLPPVVVAPASALPTVDPASPPPKADLASQLAGSVARHAASALAGILVSTGAIASNQETQAIAIFSALIIFAGSQGWSFLRKIRAAKK